MADVVPKYPLFRVSTREHSGITFYLIGQTLRGLRQLGVSTDEQQEYVSQADQGDYAKALEATRAWVTVSDDAESFEAPRSTLEHELEDLI